MTALLACIMCQIDPQSLSLAVPAAQATLIAVPFFLRSRIRAASPPRAGSTGQGAELRPSPTRNAPALAEDRPRPSGDRTAGEKAWTARRVAGRPRSRSASA